MDFGIPREVRDLESRVGLTPGSIAELAHEGHAVYVQSGAGVAAGYSDEEYRNHGGLVVYSADEVYGRADAIVKVARPSAGEYNLFRQGQTICSFLHLQVASSDLLDALRQHEMTAIAWEMIERPDGVRPVLVPMSEVAGRLAPVIAGKLLMTTAGGRGTLLGGIPGVPRGSVVILGAGVLGSDAARAFIGTGAQVHVLDNDVEKLKYLDEALGGRLTTMVATRHNLRRVCEFADVIVGAVLTSGHRAPVLLDLQMVQSMRAGAVIIDYSIDQGGCVETSRPTTLRDQTFVAEDVVHFCVPNVTAMVARTTSIGLSNAILPYLKLIGSFGIEESLQQSAELTRGVNVWEGKLRHPEMLDALGLFSEDSRSTMTTSEGAI